MHWSDNIAFPPGVVGAFCTWEAGEVVPDTPTLHATCEKLSKVSKMIFVALYAALQFSRVQANFSAFSLSLISLKTNQLDACN